jgi:iron complex outermembrane recepter protein
MTRIVRTTGLCATALICALDSAALMAQDAGSRSLEEVLVTAQRKSQSIQDVPISMSVVSADDIARNNIFDFAETAELTPGVSMNSSSASLASITVRGVGPGFFAPTAQSVPLFVDEVPATQPGAVFNTMVDVERLELLRGPQGTLYGKNAPSGAYNITTVAPSFEGVKGYVNGSYSAWHANNEPTVDLRGAINIPLGESLAARVAGVYAESDGQIDMESPFASDETTGGKDHRSVRARILWEISDTAQLHLIANSQELDDYYSLRLFDGLVPSTGGSNPVEAIYTDFSDREDFSAMRSGSSTEVDDVALKYEWAGELTNIDFILAYQNFETTLFQNQDPYPTAEPGGVDFTLDSELTTLELRASDSGEVFDYVVGVFFTDGDNESFTGLDVVQFIPADVFQQTESAAAFGNFTFHVAEQWDVTAGLRYDDNSLEYQSLVDIAGFSGSADEELDFDHVSWSFKVNFYANEDTTAYLAIDNAYRQGGINSYTPAMEALGVVLEDQAILDTAEVFLEWDEEVSTAYEVGVKGNLMDKKMRYSLAIFYQEFDDHIIRQNDPSSPDLATLGALYTLVFVNAKEVVTKGVEFDLTYLISENWTVDFRSAYFDASVEDWENRLCTYGDPNEEDLFCPAMSGSELSSAPKFNTNTQLTYFTLLEGGWNFYTTLSWTWRSESAQNSNVTARYDDPENYLNINAGISNETFSATLWGKNLTDQQTIQTPWETANGVEGLPAALTSSHNSGLQYGVTFGYNF